MSICNWGNILKWLAIVALLITGVIWFLLKRPFCHRKVKLTDIKRFVQGLLDQCVDGSILIIEHEKSERFIQFALYSSGDRPVLHFGFPKAN